MAVKRPMGALEEEVMSYLWTTSAAATPAEVHQAVAPELAYTTILTILTRLWDKERLSRERTGRAHAYQPIRTEAEDRADRMQITLADAGNRAAVLSSFVEALDADDVSLLRVLLGDGS